MPLTWSCPTMQYILHSTFVEGLETRLGLGVYSKLSIPLLSFSFLIYEGSPNRSVFIPRQGPLCQGRADGAAAIHASQYITSRLPPKRFFSDLLGVTSQHVHACL